MIRSSTLFCLLSCACGGSEASSSEAPAPAGSKSVEQPATLTGEEAEGSVHPAFSERQKERDSMVETQLRGRDIVDPSVLQAMSRVPRHAFMPESARVAAYRDHPVSIGHEQTISQPYIVAAMTQALSLVRGEKVLEIGTGSGYQAAVLAELTEPVYTIEMVEPLGQRARSDLETLGYRGVHCRIGDGYQGWPEAAPFDAIIVTAAPPEVPQPLLDQLAVGGRLVIPVGERFQELILIEKNESGTTTRKLMPVRFVPMTGKAQE